jgi:predicted permease
VLIEISTHRNGGVLVVIRNTATGLVRNPIIVAIFLGFVSRATGMSLPNPIQQLLALLGHAAAPLPCSVSVRRYRRSRAKAP